MRLHLDITNNCNLRCKTCIREYRHGVNLDPTLIASIIPQAKKIGLIDVSFTGGEPALHPYFEKIIDTVVNQNMKFSFISNGFFLDKYKFLIEKYKNYLTAANFSLDGSTKNIHDKIRQEGSFNRVLKSIRYFQSNNINTFITMTLNKLNMHQIKEMLDLALSLKVRGLKFTTAIETAFNSKIVLNTRQRLKCFLYINELFPLYSDRINIYITHALYTKGGINFCSRMNELSTMTINPKGNMTFCCDTVGDGYIIGSLYKESFISLFDKYINEVYKLKRERLNIIIQEKKIKGFNTCEFCNLYYREKYLKNVGKPTR